MAVPGSAGEWPTGALKDTGLDGEVSGLPKPGSKGGGAKPQMGSL